MFRIKRVILTAMLCSIAIIVIATGTPGLAQEAATPPAASGAAERPARKSPEEVRANIEIWQERVRKRLETIEKMATTLDLRKIDSQKVAIEELLEMLQELDGEAKQIIDAHAGLGPDLKLYRQALEAAPAVFHQIANELEQRATTTKSSLLQQNYADFAAQSRTMADAYIQRVKGIDGLELELAKRMEFVVESRTFISDVQGFLAAVPTQGGAETERLIGRINVYVDAFQEAISAMKGVANKIVEPGTGTAKPGAASPAGQPASPNPTDAIDAYRAKLKDLRKGT